MRRFIWSAIALGTALPLVADEGRLTEEEFLAPLTEEHPAIVALMERLASAEGERRASTVANPQLGFDREAPDGTAHQSVFWLSWQPPLDGRRGLRKRAAAAGVRAAESEFDWAKLQLRVVLRGAYAEWALALELRDILSEHVAMVKRLAERARVRADAGEEPGLGARRLALAAAEVESELALAEAGLVRGEAKIRVVHPELPTGVRPVRPALPVVPSKLDGSDRPDVEARRSEVQRAELEKRLSGRFLESPEFIAGWTRFAEAPGTVDGPVFGMNWSVPLFDRNQGERTQAARTVAIAEAQLELAQARAKAELEAAQGVYAQLRAAATEVMAGTADADDLVASAVASFDLGEAALTDLLETLRSVLSSQRAALELYYNALEAHRHLEASTGRSLSSGGVR
jgi:outer membrane protein TolC